MPHASSFGCKPNKNREEIEFITFYLDRCLTTKTPRISGSLEGV